MRLTVSEVVEAVQGQLFNSIAGEIEIASVEFDTRNIQQGSLFVPLKGNRDGHDFIQNAFDDGAILTFSDRKIDSTIPFILVEDTNKALQDLASFYLKKVNPKVVAITGSNGKTTTKDMNAAVANTVYETYKTQGNYNNGIGLPYTILSMEETVEVLILEMGMDHKGEIELLSKIGQPDIAAITLIGESHIEHLGSRQGIAEAKMEIVTGLKNNGVLIIPSNEPLLTPLVEEIKQKVLTFQLEGSADISAEILEEHKNQTTFKTSLYPEIIFSIPVLGKYNISNALIAILVGRELDIPVAKIQAGLAHFDLTKNRTEWLETNNGIAILSDVYNANPTAMNLVLDSFSKIDTKGGKVLVLGDMLELGEGSQGMHESVAEHIDPSAIAEVYLYGEQMTYLYEKLAKTFSSEKLHHFNKNEKEKLMAQLGQNVVYSDTVFLKASNGMGLREVVDYLLNNH